MDTLGGGFKGQRGLTQGGPLSPKIFNVVLDAFLCKWVSMVTVTEGVEELGTEGSVQDIQWLEAFFMLTMESFHQCGQHSFSGCSAS